MSLEGILIAPKTLKGKITPLYTYHTDAYMIAVRNGFIGTEAEWLESLKGEPAASLERRIKELEANKVNRKGTNAMTITDNSVALGKNAIAGCMGYYVIAIDFENNKVYLSTEQSTPVAVVDGNDSDYILADFETPAYDIGNEIALSIRHFYCFCGVIKSISGNVVELNEVLPFNEISPLSQPNFDDYTFFVPSQPWIGVVEISTGCIALGQDCKAIGRFSIAEGHGTIALGKYSHSEGNETIASSDNAHAEGYKTTASGLHSHSEGYMTEAIGYSSHSEGYKAIASGDYSHAEGNDTEASGYSSHAEGQLTNAIGTRSHAEGRNTIASEDCSHAEGYKTEAKGKSSHAEGNDTKASGNYSHSEGNVTEAKGTSSHAEGHKTIASGAYSHAEGECSEASGSHSHAEGMKTVASGKYSHSEGNRTVAASPYQHVQGRYNVEDPNSKYAHIVGNGSAANNRSNAHTIDWKGNAWYKGEIRVGGDAQDDGAKRVLIEGEPVDSVIIHSSTDGSNKKFKITVDDNGAISVAEV